MNIQLFVILSFFFSFTACSFAMESTNNAAANQSGINNPYQTPPSSKITYAQINKIEEKKPNAFVLPDGAPCIRKLNFDQLPNL